MRKLIIAAATAAALGTLGLGATAAQAQTASHSLRAATTISQTDVAGVAQSNIVKLATGTSKKKCTKQTVSSSPKLPSTVTHGTSSTKAGNYGCTVEIEGVWPASTGSYTITITYTQSGTKSTVTVKKTILPEPCEKDATGVGSDTITPLTDALAGAYDATLGNHPACSKVSTSKPYEYSWDAVNPVNGDIGDSITEKADCPSIARPDGSSAGIAQLETFNKSSSGPFCTNFARSSRARASTDDPYAVGGIAFTQLAGDAVTWSVPAINTSAPTSLTTTQLQGIFTCSITNWDQVGGADEPIAAFLPQSGSGTLSFWETFLDITPGSCVSNDGGALEENEGDNSVLDNPGAIFIYSVGDWIAQTYNADTCTHAGCTSVNDAPACVKTPNKVQFWCNVTGQGTTQGAEVLGQIGGVSPITTGSTCPKGSPKNGTTPTCINSATFPALRTLYNVVPYDGSTTDHIPGSESGAPGGLNLEGIFGASGYDCSAAGSAFISAYGFYPLSTCGTTD